MSSIELFAGAGGLAMGMAQSGFQHSLILEWNHNACETIRANRHHYDSHGEDFVLHEGDANDFDYTAFANNVEVLSGGPPCQPFSLGGKHQGNKDTRDMFPSAVRAVRQTMPKAFIFENVKGLLRQNFATYFEYIFLQLSHPDIPAEHGESWDNHLKRLEQAHGSHDHPPLYNVFFRLLNAADFGVPQKRERVFLVGFRSDLNVNWSFPEATHSEDAFLTSKWVTSEYWDRHQISRRSRQEAPKRLRRRIERLAQKDAIEGDKSAWLTVRDAIADLPDPEKHREASPNHIYIPGARQYPGHTGSPLDEPSKTLKAGDHGVPGGENMLVKDDGGFRYFTVRESARIQTFPDNYSFQGGWGNTMKQLGNAVPVTLAKKVATAVSDTLSRSEHQP
jgi:DNA (cytosine-5)-methyltransferase 1